MVEVDLNIHNSQIYTSHPDLFPESQTQIFNYLPTPWIFNSHLKTYVQNPIYSLHTVPLKPAIP